MHLLDIIIHIDQYLNQWSQFMGPWLYLLVFLIIFAETGLVVTPFLPGDSLLFALGTLTTLKGSSLNIHILSVSLVFAALLGDNVNYFLGKSIGPKVFSKKGSRIFNQQYLMRTHDFYEKHGAKAVIFARFMPIIRTFAPFVAGIGRMFYWKYLGFSFVGAILWTQLFLWAGHIFGDVPAIKSNFHIVIFTVIGISILPIVIGWWRHRSSKSMPKL